MSGIERGHVEILVHTSAPSRGQDDTRYRALAHAYLAFEPANRTALDELSQSYSQDEQTDSGLREEPESQASYRPDDEPEVVPSSVASSQNGQLSQVPLSQSSDTTDLSFNSVLDNADSPVFRERLVAGAHPAPARHAQTETQNSSDSWQQPPSTIADSQPENNLASESRPSPTKVRWASLRQMEGPRDSSSGSRLPALGKIAPSNTEAESPAEMDVTESMDLSPIIIFPIAQRSTRDDRRAHSSHDHGASFPQGSRDTMKRKHSALSSSQTDTSSSVPEGGPSKVHDKFSAKTRKSKQSHKPETSLDTMQSETTPTQVATQSSLTSSASRASYASVLEIRGPPPVASMAKLTLDTLSTPSLDQLARKMPLDVLFRPQTQTRELYAMERGYWSVNFKAWNEDLRGRAWDCLGNFVGKGQAGWAVWCFREEDFGNARVYCWGAIVGQIYLLLYMASESKIKGLGATWRGGDGQPVITMPSK